MAFDANTWLTAAYIDPAVHELRPDYRALLLLAEELIPGPSDAVSEAIAAKAEAYAQTLLGDASPTAHPHVDAWREAFRAFGAKPSRTRPSVEALLRRLPEGLPRIDRLTDVYNAVSIAHVVPLGGEDIDHYRGPLRLVRAVGDEAFDTTESGQPTVEHPSPGEVVWRDDAGVTCRRWNWRQCGRTRLTHSTTRAVFIGDALAPMSNEALKTAGEALADALSLTSPKARISSRLVTCG
ncbi:MAG: B3/B4 domain-containing protein [Mycobacteriales bacterium]